MQAPAANHYVSSFYHRAVRRGLNAGALLRQASIDPSVIDVPENRVDAEKLARLLVGIWDALQDEGMSLTGAPIPRGSFYMVGKLTIHEPNLQRVLEQIIRFYGFVTSAFAIELTADGDTASLTVKLRYPEIDSDHLHAEFCLMCWHRYCNVALRKAGLRQRPAGAKTDFGRDHRLRPPPQLDARHWHHASARCRASARPARNLVPCS